MKLSELYPNITVDQRKDLAEGAGIGLAYLRELAGHRPGLNPTLRTLVALNRMQPLLGIGEMAEEFAPFVQAVTT